MSRSKTKRGEVGDAAPTLWGPAAEGKPPGGAVALWVTPEMARQWMEKNSQNRSASETRAMSYYRDMVHGRWTLSGEPIALSPTGVLLNGQHRLMALIKYGQKVLMLVQFNCDEHAVFDRARQRTLGDVFNIAGQASGGSVASWASIHAALVANHTTGILTPSEAEIWRDHHAPDIAFGLRILTPMRLSGIGIAPVVGAFVFAFPANPMRIEDLALQFATGADLSSGSPLLACRNYVLSRTRGAAAAGKLKQAAENRLIMAKKVLRAIQLTLQGRSIEKIQRTDVGRAHFMQFHTGPCLIAGGVIDDGSR